jgi:hypothetical protein
VAGQLTRSPGRRVGGLRLRPDGRWHSLTWVSASYHNPYYRTPDQAGMGLDRRFPWALDAYVTARRREADDPLIARSVRYRPRALRDLSGPQSANEPASRHPLGYLLPAHACSAGRGRHLHRGKRAVRCLLRLLPVRVLGTTPAIRVGVLRLSRDGVHLVALPRSPHVRQLGAGPPARSGVARWHRTTDRYGLRSSDRLLGSTQSGPVPGLLARTNRPARHRGALGPWSWQYVPSVLPDGVLWLSGAGLLAGTGEFFRRRAMAYVRDERRGIFAPRWIGPGRCEPAGKRFAVFHLVALFALAVWWLVAGAFLVLR